MEPLPQWPSLKRKRSSDEAEGNKKSPLIFHQINRLVLILMFSSTVGDGKMTKMEVQEKMDTSETGISVKTEN